MRDVLAHAGSSTETTALFGGYRWDEWLGLALAMIGFVIVMTVVIRQRTQK